VATRSRKLRRSCAPWLVPTLSGWNCTWRTRTARNKNELHVPVHKCRDADALQLEVQPGAHKREAWGKSELS
jgi:hypothetical protein